ncbi:MAG: glycosyltransferase, partial [Desulfovibrio sp.]|nr:glycosyltransferase [Desulfovibrio sp.]
MNKVLLNIVMPVYNRLQLTQKSLLHLKKAKLANSAVPFVITVVDNGSDEPLREKLIFLKEEGIIDNLFLLQKNMGIACACNIGWLAVESDFFLKMDNDVVIQNPNFIQNLLKMYGLVEPFSTLGPAANRDMIPSSPKIKETPYGLLALCPKTLPGNALLIPKIVSDVLGYFNEDYGLYGAEDGDYGVRLNFAGFKQYYYRHQEYFTLEGK